MSDDASTDKITFNSMIAVLKRLDKITNFVNLNRSRGNYRVMHGFLIDYFKEICADLTKAELEDAWDELTKITKFLNSGTDIPINPKTPLKLDEIDIKLRLLAKKHGYLTTNIQSISSKLIS